MNPNPIIPDGSVIITPNEQFAELRATHDEVKLVSQKMESLTSQVGTRLTGLETQSNDHEARLRLLEKKLYRWSGMAAVAGVVGGFLAQHLPW
jgi:hypothetical protein